MFFFYFIVEKDSVVSLIFKISESKFTLKLHLLHNFNFTNWKLLYFISSYVL